MSFIAKLTVKEEALLYYQLAIFYAWCYVWRQLLRVTRNAALWVMTLLAPDQIYVQISSYPSVPFSGFRLRFYHSHLNVTHIAASSTVTDDVTNEVTRRTFNTNLQYFFLLRLHW